MTHNRLGALAARVLLAGTISLAPASSTIVQAQSATASAPASQPASRPADAGGNRPPETIGRMPPVPREVPGSPAEATPEAHPAAADPGVAPVLDRLLKALGGRAARDGMNSLRFTFSVAVQDTVRASRTHWWNRATGDYRVQGKGRDGREYVVIFNVNTRQGRASLGGHDLEGDELKSWLERGYAVFINDTYWLLMPLKLEDPGVRLKLAGGAEVGGRPCDRLEVTFDQVGLTPGDTYWIYVNRATGAMPCWGFILEGERSKPDAKETLWDWTDWETYGGLQLAGRKVKRDDPTRAEIRLTDIQVNEPLPSEAFTGPGPIKF